MSCNISGRYPFCKECYKTKEMCDDYYGLQNCTEVQIKYMLEEIDE